MLIVGTTFKFEQELINIYFYQGFFVFKTYLRSSLANVLMKIGNTMKLNFNIIYTSFSLN